MSILYTFQVVNPNNVAPFPPSVTSSDWNTSLQTYWATHEIPSIDLADTKFIIFKDAAELTAFSDELRLTDATLLADIAAWKTAHGVDYITKYYDVTESTSITVPKVV